MRIGIDARELFGRPTGVGRYLANLLAAWSTLPEAQRHTFMLYGPAGTAPGTFDPSRHRLQLARRQVAGGSGSFWEQVRLPLALRRDPPDVLFAPGYTAPLVTALPIALTIHDVSFLANPGWFSVRERVRRGLLTRLSARKARAVLTVSRFSRDEIVRLLGVPVDRVQVIANGVTSPRPPGGAIGERDSHAGSVALSERAREPLVLFVGSIFNRRRVPDLIRAFARVAREMPELRMEIVGDNRTHPHEDLDAVAAACGVAGSVGIRAYVPEETLADLYARASVFGFLSDYEGFGLTPLEALANGVPSVVLDTAVARDVYGDAAVYVPPGDTAETAAALRALLVDRDLRTSILERAPAVLGRYSWERAGRDTLAAIERAGEAHRAAQGADLPRAQQEPDVTDLAIIVVSYNAREDLDRCLRGLRADPPLTPHEIVVVDNASSDGSPAMVRAGWPGVRVIEAGGNVGFSRANNLGIRATSSDLLLLLNSDAIATGGAIDRLVAELRSRPDAAVAGPRLVDANGRPEVSFGRMMSPFGELRQKSLGRLYDARVPCAVSWVRRRTSTAHCPDWVSGACLLVWRADADQVGLLDERFYMYGEDVDFCASVRARGRSVLFTPEAEIVHLRGRSVRHAPAAAERLYRISHLAFYAKHHPRWVPWLRIYLRVRGRLPDEATRTKSEG